MNSRKEATLQKMKILAIADNLTQADYFKDIVATIREPLVVLDADLRVLSANRSFYKFFKVRKKETVGNLIYDLGNRQWDIPALRHLLETILPQKAVFNDYEVDHDFPSLGRRSLLLNARRIPAAPKEAQWILLAFEDISERMRLERTLQASEVRFRRAFETAQDGMLLIEKTGGQIENSNPSAEDSLGYSKGALKKKTLWDIGILKDEQQFKRTALELEDQGMVGLPDVNVPTRRGGHFPADVYLTDRAAVIQCNIREISERKQMVEKLQESEKRFRTLMEHSKEEISLIDPDGTLTWESPTSFRPLGYPPNTFVGRNIFDLFHPDERAAAARMMGKIREHPGSAQEGLFRLRHQDGSWHWVEGSLINLLEEPAVQSLVINYRDVTERMQAEEGLRESEERYRTLFMNMQN
jgi:PAS domain S-box-containing protein